MPQIKVKNLLEIIAQYTILHPKSIRGCYGDCDYNDMIIRIASNQSLHQRVDTLVHECLHAHYNDIGIDASEQRVLKETKQIMKRFYGNIYNS